MAAPIGLEIPSLLVLLIGLLIVWVIASIPAYVAGKIVTGGRATFGQAMGATLGGVVVFILTLVVVSLFLGELIGATAYLWALILGFIAFLAVYRSVFDTSWLGAFAIAIMALVVAVILNLLVGALFGVSYPGSLAHAVNV